jgi:hypothetical protein
MVSMCIQQVEERWNLGNISHFTWMTVSDSPNWKDVEPSVQLLINNGVPPDDIKCFDQLSHLKKSLLPWWKRIQQFVSTPEMGQIFWKLKNWCHSELLKI